MSSRQTPPDALSRRAFFTLGLGRALERAGAALGEGLAAAGAPDRLRVDETRCLPHRDVACGVCALSCPVGPTALALDARGRPVVGADCTGCGICIAACVTSPSAITAGPRAG